MCARAGIARRGVEGGWSGLSKVAGRTSGGSWPRSFSLVSSPPTRPNCVRRSVRSHRVNILVFRSTAIDTASRYKRDRPLRLRIMMRYRLDSRPDRQHPHPMTLSPPTRRGGRALWKRDKSAVRSTPPSELSRFPFFLALPMFVRPL